jgi:hypothetical protein
MHGMQGTFPRCKKRLPSDSLKRRLRLDSIVLIHNFRTEMVGSNQIQTVFDPEYERYSTFRNMKELVSVICILMTVKVKMAVVFRK